MKVIDQLTSQLETLGHEVRELPAALDTISACRDAGVIVPPSHKFADIHALDAALDLAFAFDGKPMDRPTLDRRVKLKNSILAAGMVGQPEPEKTADERAVRYAANLLRQHKIALRPNNEMFTIKDIDAAAAERKLSISDRFHLKISLERAQLLQTEGTRRPDVLPSRPSDGLVRRAFASIGEETPRKMSAVAAMRARGITGRQAIEIKSVISAAGLLDA
jgi:hypothetical protein